MNYQEMVWSAVNHDIGDPQRYLHWLSHLTDEELLEWSNKENHRSDKAMIGPVLKLMNDYVKQRGLS